MRFAAFTFFVIFLLVASGGLLVFYREAMLQRISAVVASHQDPTTLKNRILHTKAAFSDVMAQFERVLPKSSAEVSVVEQRLIRAGYRSEAAVKTFYGTKVLVPIVLCIVVAVTGVAHYGPFVIYAAALGLGFLAPDFWLSRRIKTRQTQIRLGLPDVLDLLVICIEAGQSLDGATVRTAEELSKAHPAITEELGIVALEQRAGRPRSEAWRNFADRTGVDSVRNLVSVLVQSEQFGTSAAKTLRVHADTLRTQRRQKVEEQAAKTTVKLVFPLVLFIFPAMFVVTLGPAAIIMVETFHTYFKK